MWNRFIHDKHLFMWINVQYKADLAQLVERKALNLVVMGSSPIVGVEVESMGMGTISYVKDIAN